MALPCLPGCVGPDCYECDIRKKWKYHRMNQADSTRDPTDPIHQGEDDKWFFWDETWAFEEGPYETEAKAREALEIYCAEQLGL